MRVISSQAQSELATGRAKVRCLLSAFPDGVDPLHIWDGRGTVTIEGTTYVGSAGRFTVQAAASSLDLSPRATDVTLSGLDADVADMILATEWHQRPIVIRRAIFAADGASLLGVFVEFSGYMDTAPQREQIGGLTTITVRCETFARELARSGVRTRSDADQRLRDADDDFFASSVAAMNTSIDWGRAPEKPQKPGGIGGLLSKIF